MTRNWLSRLAKVEQQIEKRRAEDLKNRSTIRVSSLGISQNEFRCKYLLRFVEVHGHDGTPLMNRIIHGLWLQLVNNGSFQNAQEINPQLANQLKARIQPFLVD